MRPLALLVLFLTGCAVAPYYYPTPAAATPTYGTRCAYRIADQTLDGQTIPAGYACALGAGESPRATALGCSYVYGYTKANGVHVDGHTRCPTDIGVASYTPSPYAYPAPDRAPCVTGYCGPVQVRGYFRKDGTYVRPHTRSRPRR